jgi:hypothetical protein
MPPRALILIRDLIDELLRLRAAAKETPCGT